MRSGTGARTVTGKLFALTARDQNGDLVEWFVEATPGTLAYFTEEQARELMRWALRTGSFFDVRANEVAQPAAGEVSPRVTGEPDYFVEDLSFSAIGFLRGRLQ